MYRNINSTKISDCEFIHVSITFIGFRVSLLSCLITCNLIVLN